MELLEDLGGKLDTSLSFSTDQSVFVLLHFTELAQSGTNFSSCDKPLLIIDMLLALFVEENSSLVIRHHLLADSTIVLLLLALIKILSLWIMIFYDFIHF